MKVFYFIIQIVWFLGAVGAGYYCGRHFPRARNFLAAFGLCMIFFENIISHFPEYEILIFPFNDYIFFRRWGYAGAFFVFGVSFSQVQKSTRQLLYVLISLLCVLRIYFLYIVLYPVYDFQERGFDEYGVCIQSTGYTCGAAACATMLSELGLPATEIEMAQLCGTNQYTGTQFLELVRGLNLKTEGKYEAKIFKKHWDSLAEKDFPCITSVKFNSVTGHLIVLCGIKKDSIIVKDPLQGMKTVPKEEFEKDWSGRIVVISLQQGN